MTTYSDDESRSGDLGGLRRRVAELESELAASRRAETSTLRALATVAESAAVLAHEIKNPITAVHLALRAVAEALGEDHKPVLEDLEARMRHLEKLIRGTLSFAKPLEIRPVACEARELLLSTVERLRPELQNSGSEAQVAVEEDVLLLADPKHLDEVIANLVSNAIEAKGRGVHVVLSAVRAGHDDVFLTVEDDGPGFLPEQRESIFKPFVSTKSGATGLGLATCKKIVEEHGGTIHAEPRAEGARFVIRLKAEAQGISASAPTHSR